MKVTFPHMGTLWVSLKTMLQEMGLDVIVPPPTTKRTLSLGTRYSPESICMPLKIGVGNYLEAAEQGADTFVMAGGIGPCRFGYYARLQKEILEDLGSSMDMIVVEPPEKHLVEVFHKLNRLKRCSTPKAIGAVKSAWLKCCVLDAIEKKVQEARPREARAGQSDVLFSRTQKKLDEADSRKTILSVQKEAVGELESLMQHDTEDVLHIGIVGEIYTILEPFMTQDMERHLGKMGVQVHRTLYLSNWVNDHVLGSFFDLGQVEDFHKLAAPYLNHMVGGHGLETIGTTVLYARQGLDGVIQVAPLTCGPEIVAEAILPKVSLLEGIPVMTLYVDEQSGEAGLLTRLEAFVDMIRVRRQSLVKGKKRSQPGACEN